MNEMLSLLEDVLFGWMSDDIFGWILLNHLVFACQLSHVSPLARTPRDSEGIVGIDAHPFVRGVSRHLST